MVKNLLAKKTVKTRVRAVLEVKGHVPCTRQATLKTNSDLGPRTGRHSPIRQLTEKM